MKKWTILIQNGWVIDPANRTDRIQDVAIDGGILIDSRSLPQSEYEQVVDATGCLVTPGWFDFHTHLAAHNIPIGTTPDSFFASGVTAVVDAGSAGAVNYNRYIELVQNSYTKSWSYLSMTSHGFENHPILEDSDPELFDEPGIITAFARYPDRLLGLKLRISQSIIGRWGLAPLQRTREIADRLGCRIAVHTTDPVAPVDEVLSYFRTGDVFTHCFHGRGHTIIGPSGHVLPSVREARGRGVLFCCANGTSHFAFSTAEAALNDGFYPDIISTDNGRKSLYKRPPMTRSFSLPYTMSKYLLLGMPLFDIIRCVTQTPARAVGHPELGCLSVGTPGDVTISRLISKQVDFFDSEGVSRRGAQLLKPEMTICDGVCTYRQIDFFS